MSRSSQTDPPAVQRRATDEEARLRQSLPPPDAGAAQLHTQPGFAPSPQQAVTAAEPEPDDAAEAQTQDSAVSSEAAVSDTAAKQPAGAFAGGFPLDTLDIGPAATPLVLSPADDKPDAADAPLPSDVGQDAPANGNMPVAVPPPSPADAEPDAADAPLPSASDVGQDAPATGNMPVAVLPPSPADAQQDAPANGNMPAPWHADKTASAGAASPERPGPSPLPLPQRVALRSVSDGAVQSGAEQAQDRLGLPGACSDDAWCSLTRPDRS